MATDLNQAQGQHPPRMNVYTRVIPANTEILIDVLGTFVGVKEAKGDVQIGLDQGPSVPFAVGISYTCDSGDFFRQIRVKDVSGAQNTVQIFAGNGQFRDTRMTVDVTRGFSGFVRDAEAPSRILSQVSSTLAANSGITLPGTFSGSDLSRKALLVSNEDTANKVYIQDPLGNVGAVCFPLQSIMLPVSDSVTVFNPNGAAIQVRISELIYTSS